MTSAIAAPLRPDPHRLPACPRRWLVLLGPVCASVSAAGCSGSSGGSSEGPAAATNLESSQPADGAFGVRPDLRQIDLMFDHEVSPIALSIELQPLDFIDGSPDDDDSALELQPFGSLVSKSISFPLPGSLDSNRAYSVSIGARDPSSALAAETAIAFTTGIVPPDGPLQKATGLVLDDSGQPLSGVRMRLEHTNEFTLTDVSGAFEFLYVPVGPQVVEVNAHPTGEFERYATLHFPVLVIDGFDASLRRPVYLPQLDLENAVTVDPFGVTEVTSPKIPGFRLAVLPGAARFPDGSVPRQLSVTEVSVQNPPMGPPAGTAFERLYTIQPPGVIFSPPADVEYPAPQGLKVGDQVPLVHFGAGAMRWVAFGQAKVVDDGGELILRSLDGQGVIRTAWQAPAPQTVYTEVVGVLEGNCLSRTDVLKLADLLRKHRNAAVVIGAKTTSIAILRARSAFPPFDFRNLKQWALDVIWYLVDWYLDFIPGYTALRFLADAQDELEKDAVKSGNFVYKAQQFRQAVDDLLKEVDSDDCLTPEEVDAILRAKQFNGQIGNELDAAATALMSAASNAGQSALAISAAAEGMYQALAGFSIDGDADEATQLVEIHEANGTAGLGQATQAIMDAERAVRHLDQALALAGQEAKELAGLSHVDLGCFQAVADGITFVGRHRVLGFPVGTLVSVSGRSAFAGPTGEFRILGVPAGITVGGGLHVFTLCPSTVSPLFLSTTVDTDVDALPDDWETYHRLSVGMDDSLSDPDADELVNLDEYLYFGDPNDPDSDDDGVSDGEEVRSGGEATEPGGNPLAPAIVSVQPSAVVPPARVIIRGDNFGTDPSAIKIFVGSIQVAPALVTLVASNEIAFEVMTSFQAGVVTVLRDDPVRGGVLVSNGVFLDRDSDGDGLGDQLEEALGTNPNLADTDADGLDDGDEQLRGTNPLDCDTDADGLSDGFEVTFQMDPTDSDSDDDGTLDGDEDTDGDGVRDEWEEDFGTDPTVAGPSGDADSDGLPDAAELGFGSDPFDPDTDDDGVLDSREATEGLSILVNDTDGDGLSDGTELEDLLDLWDPRDPEDHADLVIHAGETVGMRGKNVLRSLTIETGGRLTTAESDNPLVHRIDVEAGTVIIQEGGSIDAVGKGYRGGFVLDGTIQGRSFGNTTIGAQVKERAGGSHGGGGAGWDAQSNVTWGITYGTHDRPVQPGAGGNAVYQGNVYNTYALGGDGGGCIRIVCQNLVLDGTIDASGESTCPAGYWNINGDDDRRGNVGRGPGAGGSVWIAAGNWTGSGTLRADGGSGLNCGANAVSFGAGGGRVAIELSTLPLGNEPIVSCRGGSSTFNLAEAVGAPGTIFRVDPDNPNGVLVVQENLGTYTPVTRFPGFGGLEVQGGGCRIVFPASSLLPEQMVGLELALDDGTILGRIIHNGSDWVELDVGMTNPPVGTALHVTESAGTIQGDAAASCQWSGLLKLLGESALADALISGGSWTGARLDLGPRVSVLDVKDATLSIDGITQEGTNRLSLDLFECSDSSVAFRNPGAIDVALVTARHSNIACGMRIQAELFELLEESTWSPPQSYSGFYLPVDIKAINVFIEGPDGDHGISSIDASGRGYSGGIQTPAFKQFGETYPGTHAGGAMPGSRAHAGSHGGLGGYPSSAKVYGLPDKATFPGGGGGFNNFFHNQANGGNGGGVIRIAANSVRVDGEIRSNGGPGFDDCPGQGISGSGAGGSITLEVDELSGSGAIRADGGVPQPRGPCPCATVGHGAGGGGGRVAVNALLNSYSGSYSAHGGLGSDALPSSSCVSPDTAFSGGAGTIWLADRDSIFGSLIIDNAGVPTPYVSTPLVALPVGSGTATVDSTGHVLRTDRPVYTDPTSNCYGHTGRWVIVDGDVAAPARVVAFGADWLELDRAYSPGAVVQYRGALYFDAMIVRGSAWADDLDEQVVIPGGTPIVEGDARLD